MGFVPMTMLSQAVLLFALALTMAPVQAERRVDDLLRLVPPDVLAVASVESLREHAARLETSRLAAHLQSLPTFRAWRESDDARRFEQARAEIEQVLGMRLQTLRDDILGDSVVLSLHPGRPDMPANVRGLVLVQPRDAAALERLVSSINDQSRKDKRFERIEPRHWHDAAYSVRLPQAGGEPSDAYAFLSTGVFAWANSEALLREVIDRHAASPPAEIPAWITTQRLHLPKDALASLQVRASVLADAIEATRTAEGRSNDPVDALARSAARSLESVGMAVRLQDDVECHLLVHLDPDRLEPSLRRLLQSPRAQTGEDWPIPPSAFAVAAGSWNYAGMLDLILEAVPEDQRPDVSMIETALSGMALGLDVRKEIILNLGPATQFLALQRSATGGATEGGGPGPHWPEGVFSVQLRGEARLAAALANALRTLFAVASLDEKTAPKNPKLDARQGSNEWTIHWSAGDAEVVVWVTPSRLVIGSSEAAVGAVRENAAQPVSSVLETLRAKQANDAVFFLGIDHTGLARWIDGNREWLAAQSSADSGQAIDKSRRELENLVALLGLFQTSAMTVAVEENGRWIRQMLELAPTTEAPPVTEAGSPRR